MNSTNFLSSKLLLGVAETDITPETAVELVGFYRQKNISQGVLSPLSAQVSVWRTETELCCLIAIDHIGFCLEHASFLRDRIGKILGIPRQKVMLCFSHTHSAPNDSTEPEYFRFLCNRIEQTAQKAMENLSPVRTGWGNAFADIGINRRTGCEIDRRIGILKAEEKQTGKLKLIVLRVTAHANVFKADNFLISSDYFGEVRKTMSEKYGCPVIITQGASGNVAPKYFQSQFTPPDADDPSRFVRSQTACADMAREILTQTGLVWEKIRLEDTGILHMDSCFTDFYADVPSYEKACKIMEEAQTLAGIDGSAWLQEIQKLHQNGIKRQICSVEIQYFQIANGCLCGVPNEIMCEFALRACHLAQNDRFYLGGYTNGCTGYFPTEEEFDQGGYEVYWSWLIYYPYHKLLSPPNRDSCRKLIYTAVRNRPSV